MENLKTNPLLWASIVVSVAYWLIAPLVMNPFLSVAMAIAVMITASVAMIEYGPEAWRVVVKKKRSADEYGRGRGSHLAIFGFFMFAFGSVFSGAYAIAWSWYGQPVEWIGSASANFGRFCHAAGFGLMQAGPALQKEGFVLTRSWWATVIGAIVLVLLGFYLGMQVKAVETTDSMAVMKAVSSDRPLCPPNTVRGSEDKVFHTSASPYLQITTPRRCFRDEDAAKAAGFRAIKE